MNHQCNNIWKHMWIKRPDSSVLFITHQLPMTLKHLCFVWRCPFKRNVLLSCSVAFYSTTICGEHFCLIFNHAKIFFQGVILKKKREFTVMLPIKIFANTHKIETNNNDWNTADWIFKRCKFYPKSNVFHFVFLIVFYPSVSF